MPKPETAAIAEVPTVGRFSLLNLSEAELVDLVNSIGRQVTETREELRLLTLQIEDLSRRRDEDARSAAVARERDLKPVLPDLENELATVADRLKHVRRPRVAALLAERQALPGNWAERERQKRAATDAAARAWRGCVRAELADDDAVCTAEEAESTRALDEADPIGDYPRPPLQRPLRRTAQELDTHMRYVMRGGGS